MNKLLIIFMIGLFCCFSNENKINDFDKIKLESNISFDEQLNTFFSLGYKLNDGITKENIFESATGVFGFEENIKEYFEKKPFERLYYHLGWSKFEGGRKHFTSDCIWYDLEFIDPSTEYIEFMKRMGEITHGEISYSEINLRVDNDNYEWIDFKVNGVSKSWKLAKVRYIDDSFFQRFSFLPKELKTNGKYTYYDDGGQQFVIDYATDSEQKEFIEKTGLKREWLGVGNHFSEHDPNK